MKRFLRTKAFRITTAAVALLLILAGIGFYINPYRGTVSWGEMRPTLALDEELTQEQYRSELRYMLGLIEDRHYSSVDKLPEKVLAHYQEELAHIPDRPLVLDLWRSGSRILKQLNDAHSSMNVIHSQPNPEALPIGLKQTGRHLFAASGPHQGQEVTKINGVETDEWYNRFLDLFSYENLYYAEYKFPNVLKSRITLSWLGIDNTDQVTFTFSRNGQEETENYRFEPVARSASSLDFVRYTIDKEKGVGILTLDSCRYNDHYKETLKAFFTQVQQQQIPAVAIDLRNNGGGDSRVANEFMKYLPIDQYKDFGSGIRIWNWTFDSKPGLTDNKKDDSLVFQGDLYVLTSKHTFSSATWFAVLLSDNQLAKIIGEPSGNKPSAYGDVLSFQLPYSKLQFSLTYKRFARPEQSRDHEEALLPDYLVDVEQALPELYRVIGAE